MDSVHGIAQMLNLPLLMSKGHPKPQFSRNAFTFNEMWRPLILFPSSRVLADFEEVYKRCSPSISARTSSTSCLHRSLYEMFTMEGCRNSIKGYEVYTCPLFPAQPIEWIPFISPTITRCFLWKHESETTVTDWFFGKRGCHSWRS